MLDIYRTNLRQRTISGQTLEDPHRHPAPLIRRTSWFTTTPHNHNVHMHTYPTHCPQHISTTPNLNIFIHRVLCQKMLHGQRLYRTRVLSYSAVYCDKSVTRSKVVINITGLNADGRGREKKLHKEMSEHH